MWQFICFYNILFPFQKEICFLKDNENSCMCNISALKQKNVVLISDVDML